MTAWKMSGVQCPECGLVSSVIETRGARRRRECTNGHRFTTIEVVFDEKRNPVTAVSPKNFKVGDAAVRAIAADQRDVQAIAAEYRISAVTVYRLKRNATKERAA